MQKITVPITQRHLYELKARQRLGDADSRSAALRQILDEYADLRPEYADLEAEYDDLKRRYEAREDRVETLETQLAERSQIEAKIEDLPRPTPGVDDVLRREATAGDRPRLPRRAGQMEAHGRPTVGDRRDRRRVTPPDPWTPIETRERVDGGVRHFTGLKRSPIGS